MRFTSDWHGPGGTDLGPTNTPSFYEDLIDRFPRNRLKSGAADGVSTPDRWRAKGTSGGIDGRSRIFGPFFVRADFFVRAESARGLSSCLPLRFGSFSGRRMRANSSAPQVIARRNFDHLFSVVLDSGEVGTIHSFADFVLVSFVFVSFYSIF
jgi:hypothetical protein